jgi:hypothetical protein
VLVHNIFYKVVMVRDYPTALQYAKDHKLTCITPDQQVVYSGAFITKVGSSRAQTTENRVTLLLKIASLQREHHDLSEAFSSLQRS